MIRWLLLVAILLFIAGQITRMRPSGRDQQLEALRQAASRAGLLVRFWTARNSGYRHHQLPESAFAYWLPWPPDFRFESAHWALWVNAAGDWRPLVGNVPEEARAFIDALRGRFPDAWALLEYNASGIGLVWQERGVAEDVTAIAAAMVRLRDRIGALPGS